MNNWNDINIIRPKIGTNCIGWDEEEHRAREVDYGGKRRGFTDAGDEVCYSVDVRYWMEFPSSPYQDIADSERCKEE